MTEPWTILETARNALHSEPRIGSRAGELRVELTDGTLVVEGEVSDIAAKKLALERIARIGGVDGIVDRLRVQPATPMGDREIAQHLRDAYLQEPAFAGLGVSVSRGDTVESARATAESGGFIGVEVHNGIVTLNGRVPGLDHKRLAGVLAWWVPGSRDVINGIAVEPDEPDSDHAITGAVRLVLEKDPFVDAGQIRVGAKDSVVRLTGLVPTPSERDMAEFDAWYVFGVDRVINEIEIRS